MSTKKTKKQKEAVLTWQEFRARRRGLVGGTVEILSDCSFDAMSHQFVRGTIVSVSWRKGKPAVVRFRDAVKCVAADGRLGPWSQSTLSEFNCSQGWPFPLLPKGVVDQSRKNAWIKNGVVSFVTADHTDVALYPKGVMPEATPFFYKSARWVEMFCRLLTKATD